MSALAKVAEACSQGRWPAPADVLAMLHESGRCTAGDARDLVSKYAASLPEPSGEAGVLVEALRSFSLH